MAADVRSLKLVLEYDGTDFAGWQRQRDARTVQGELERALADLAGAPVLVVGAGRTDAGVHARAQVASAQLASSLSDPELRAALNARLPPDLAVREVATAPAGFDARRQARAKRYRYAIWNGPQRSPLRTRSAWHVPRPLCLEAVRRAATPLRGTHDFAAFRSLGSSARTTVRTLTEVEVAGERGGDVAIELEGTGFLRHMVRAIVGTLVEVGLSRRDPASVVALLESRDRSLAGVTAPARGLVLLWVDYGPAAAPPGATGPPPSPRA